MMHRVVSASLSPNAEPDDVWRSLVMLCSPWQWWTGTHLNAVRKWFLKRYDGVSDVVLFDSGRSALFGILRAFGIGKGDEVIVQAFTCVAVPNSVLWTGATPVYADIDDTYNIDTSHLSSKITIRTRAIVVQHTFGLPANMSKILRIAKRHGLLVIEDCAHALGGAIEGIPLGAWGDAAFMSFGRDKSLSSVWGGAALIKRTHRKPSEALRKFGSTLPKRSGFWIFQQLMHPLAFACILPLYRLGIGKAMLVILQKLSLLSLPVFQEEKRGGRPHGFPSSYPNALAFLLLGQLAKLERYTSERRAVASYYRNALKDVPGIILCPDRGGTSYLRFPVLTRNPDEIIRRAKSRGILLGNWYRHVIDPAGVEKENVRYAAGSCPVAERMASSVINLPTRITLEEAKRVVVFFNTIDI